MILALASWSSSLIFSRTIGMVFRADGSEAHRLFYETYGDESLAVLLDPADDGYQESMAFYKKAIPEYAH